MSFTGLEPDSPEDEAAWKRIQAADAKIEERLEAARLRELERVETEIRRRFSQIDEIDRSIQRYDKLKGQIAAAELRVSSSGRVEWRVDALNWEPIHADETFSSPNVICVAGGSGASIRFVGGAYEP